MGRRLLVFFACTAISVVAVGYVLTQDRTTPTEIDATAITLLAPLSDSPDTTTPSSSNETTIRSTLPPTQSSEVFQFAADDGCTPGGNQLPDGTYHGSVVINEDQSMAFNLKCLFVTDDLPDNFEELFSARFPDELLPATGSYLIDPAPIDRRVQLVWNSELTFDGGLYLGEQAYSGFVDRDEVPFDATIVIEEGVARTVVEIQPGISPS